MSVFPFQILQSWGIASARHTSGMVVSPHSNLSDGEFLFDAPLGPLVIRWDVVNQKRLLQFQAHYDLVMCMRTSPCGRYIATSCYSGEVKLWSPTWECLDETTAPMAQQHHLAWSHDSKRFLVVGNGFDSSIVSYSVEEEKNGTTKLQQLWQVRIGEPSVGVRGQATEVKGQDTEGKAQSTGDDPSIRNTGRDYNYGNAFYMAEITPSGNIFAIEEQQHGGTYLHLYSPEGKLLKVVKLALDGSDKRMDVMFMSTYRKGEFAVGVQGGRVVFVGAESLAVRIVAKVGFTSRSCTWDGDNLVLPSDSGKLAWWSLSGEKLCEFKVGSTDYIVRLDWSASGHALWMVGFGTLSYLEVKRNSDGSPLTVLSTHTIHCHEITCCGVGFSPSGQSLASGDLAGNVWITQQDDPQPQHKCSVGASVRCLAWKNESTLLVGCLDGLVYQWEVKGQQEPQVLFAMEGSIIHTRLDHRQKYLAVGTSKGDMGVYDMTVGERFICPVAVFTAHPPRKGKQDIRFGQLTKQAEIWSLCWDPDDTRIATCSEDQSTKIWETKTWKCLATLTGHTLAVTSVDWKAVGGKSIIATCSDDRTIRLVDSGSYELMSVLDTKDIHGWHTLTYIAFDPIQDSSRLACTTQNGHLVVWDVALEQPRLARGKMHYGSIEGLAWDKHQGCLATVGADCAVHLIQLNL